MSNDIKTAVAAATDKLIASGAIEQEIEKALAKTVTQVINDQLTSYSTFGKELREHVEKALAVNLDKLTLPSYGQSILALVNNLVRHKAEESIAVSVKKELETLLANPEREVKLSELLDRFKQQHKDDYDRGERISVFIRRDDDRSSSIRFPMLYLSPKQAQSTRDVYSWPIRLHLYQTGNTAEIIGVQVDQRDASKDPMFALGCDRFGKSLYSMFASKTVLVMDVEDDEIDLDLPEREDECHCD